MKRTTATTAVTVAAVAAGAVALGTTQTAIAHGGPHHRTFTLVAQDSEGTITPADFGTSPAPNQQAALDAPVYRDGRRVGLAETVMTLTRVVGDDVAAMIECSIELPDGNILFNGSFHMDQLATGAHVPVVGGTGLYSGSRGTVVMRMTTPDSTTLAFDVSTK